MYSVDTEASECFQASIMYSSTVSNASKPAIICRPMYVVPSESMPADNSQIDHHTGPSGIIFI